MTDKKNTTNYGDESIIHLEGVEHIRRRPGMYIGRLGDGSNREDGIYVLLKETIDNSIDEFNEGFGKRIEIEIEENHSAKVRDYGRGIPLGGLIPAVSQLNTGAKYDTSVFTASVGLNGVGLKAVNALSQKFVARSHRDGQYHEATFEYGKLISDNYGETTEEDGTYIYFEPDPQQFRNFRFRAEYVEFMLRNYTYLNTGLAIYYNNRRIASRNGLEDLLNDNMTATPLYDIIHIKGDSIDIAFTHANQNGEEYYSYVNGQHTTQGGTHQSAFKEHIAKTIKEHLGKNYEPNDIRNGLVAAIAIRVIEPTFESQTKIKLGSLTMAPEKDSKGNPFPLSGVSINKFVGDFIKKNVDNYLHIHPETAEEIQKKIQESERDRKAMAGLVSKAAKERAKKININNPKLRDCILHFNDPMPKAKKGTTVNEDNDPRLDTSIFITEGLSASGSITKCRDAQTQAVFSLRGKPYNSFGETKELVYKNEEFNLLQAALNIEDGLDGLRYNKVIVATDADVDGMHIRLLMLTFFLQFFPELIKKGHVYILQTPLFRVRTNKKKTRPLTKTTTIDDNSAGAAILKKRSSNERSEYITRYCYSEEERLKAIEELGPDPQITRFKGLGEISPDEFKEFIGPEIRLEQVSLHKTDQVKELLSYYMGKNTPERQSFIINNLIVEEDKPDEDFSEE